MDLRSSHGSTPAAGIVLVRKKPTWEVSTYGKIYASLIVVESLSLIAFCVLSILYAHSHASDEIDQNSVEYTSIVAIVTSVALLYFSLDSILLENIFQFWCSIMLHSMICAYVIWHYLGQGDDLGQLYDKFSLWIMVGVCCFQFFYLLLAYPVQETFGWRLYKKIGGNVAIRPIYRTATIFFSLMKLDFALGVILVMLAVFYLITDVTQIILNVLACLATLGWLILGFSFVQRESRRLAPYFFLFATLEPSFLIYKLIAMKLNPGDTDADDPDANPNNDKAYPVFSWNEFLFTGCVAVVVRILCIATGAICMKNFGLGLKEKIWYPNSSLASTTNQQHTGVNPHHTTHASGALAVNNHHQGGLAAGLNHSGIAGQPVVVVAASSPQDRGFKSYIQPLL